MNLRKIFGRFSSEVAFSWFFFLITSHLPSSISATDIKKDDAATAESNDDVVRYTDRIRAYVNITFTDPLTGKQRSEKSLKGKWGTNGRMEQVVAPAHIAKYSGNKTDGCHKLDQPVPTGQWIAIIERGQCRFSEKIRNAVDANATAVIIYDNEPNKTPLFMHHDVENAVAIFITKEFGDRIVELIEDNDTNVLVRITIGLEPSQYPRINRTSVLFVSISFIVLMIISLAWLIFYYIQRFRYAHAKDRLAKRLSQAAKKAITKIPVRTLKASDKEVDSETDACAICIDSFLVGETVRVLPCQHLFHKSCVDPWLLEQRTCPMCKLDILKAYGLQVCPSQDSLSRGGGRTSRPTHILAGSEEGLGFDSVRDDDLMNGFPSEPSSAFRSSPRIVHIATSISAAGRLANAPPPPRNNNLTSRIESFSRPRNMVCPRHGVSVGSCSHDVGDLTPEEVIEDSPTSSSSSSSSSSPIAANNESIAIVTAAEALDVLDRVEEFAEIPLDNDPNSPSAAAAASMCRCSGSDDLLGAVEQDHRFDENGAVIAASTNIGGAMESKEVRPKSELLPKEVYLLPSLPGALDNLDGDKSGNSGESSTPPTPPPTHPLTPETLITSRTPRGPAIEPVFSHRRCNPIGDEEASPSATPASERPNDVGDAAFVVEDAAGRPQSALSNLSCNETTKLNSQRE